MCTPPPAHSLAAGSATLSLCICFVSIERRLKGGYHVNSNTYCGCKSTKNTRKLLQYNTYSNWGSEHTEVMHLTYKKTLAILRTQSCITMFLLTLGLKAATAVVYPKSGSRNTLLGPFSNAAPLLTDNNCMVLPPQCFFTVSGLPVCSDISRRVETGRQAFKN